MIYCDSAWEGKGGIGTFASNVIRRLSRVSNIVEIKFPSRSALGPFIISFYSIFLKKNGVIFFPGYIPPLFSKVPFVFTIHDLNHIERSENTSFLKRIFYSLIIRPSCRRADVILTVSEYSKSKIVNWSGVEERKVINVGNGVDLSFNTEIEPLDVDYPYFLCVGNRKKHKNEAALIHSFSLANIDKKTKLLFTGFCSDELKQLISTLGMSERIIFLGHIAGEQLPSVYRGAVGLLFPSLYEGFGLPVVEAMACGIPVLTSNTTSLPEVAGDAALLVNPESIDEIRIGIERLTTDQALRENLISKGLERAKLFSWDAVAARVQAVLNEVASQHGR